MNYTTERSVERRGTNSFENVYSMRSSQSLRKIKSEDRDVQTKFPQSTRLTALVGGRIVQRSRPVSWQAGPTASKEFAEHDAIDGVYRDNLPGGAISVSALVTMCSAGLVGRTH